MTNFFLSAFQKYFRCCKKKKESSLQVDKTRGGSAFIPYYKGPSGFDDLSNTTTSSSIDASMYSSGSYNNGTANKN